ncbi:uncharacterized protein LMH87_008063 [Akanthomyces muscarius]|uniref:Uncharacterized protein n=1 Tax=Akanthomyces muscarius TaxID=2231603 RepID=A0A9W8UQH5_AKAMU|nr:uncharacterized protein LMH87_008063 [Akanthomyces muscarius]KAJ4159151.1 hypothetical protein LMH87_008063 [Akanthomyces muscarius]
MSPADDRTFGVRDAVASSEGRTRNAASHVIQEAINLVAEAHRLSAASPPFVKLAAQLRGGWADAGLVFWPLVMTHDGSAWTRPQRRKHALIEEFVLGLAQHRSAHGAVPLMFRRSEDCENAM